VFVWIFHRVSGVLLILLMLFQVSTGLAVASPSSAELAKTMAGLHKHATVNCLLVFLFVFHSLYGLRTILLDLGLKREKLLFWIATVLGTVLFAVFLVIFWTLVGA
jgi:succinate dehydrogenase cytochrome b556 subunit